MKPILLFVLTSLTGSLLILTSCGEKEARREAKLNKGFRLPTGDKEKGKQAFVQMNCHHCHSVEGAELPAAGKESAIHFPLGGEVNKVKTYGELVTAIIQPDHVVSPDYLATIKKEAREGIASPMPKYNESMTVQQLTDLVFFLHGHYTKIVPTYDVDAYYYY